MKKFVFIAAMATVFSAPALAEKAGHGHGAKRGGVVAEAKDGDYELVAKPDIIQLYVSDHGKSMDLSKATGKLTLVQGPDKQEVSLSPAGDKLEAKGTFKVVAGTKATAVVTNGGRALNPVSFNLK